MAASCRASITKRVPRSAICQLTSNKRAPICAARRGRNAGCRPGWLLLERLLEPGLGEFVRDVGLDRFGRDDVALGGVDIAPVTEEACTVVIGEREFWIELDGPVVVGDRGLDVFVADVRIAAIVVVWRLVR